MRHRLALLLVCCLAAAAAGCANDPPVSAAPTSLARPLPLPSAVDGVRVLYEGDWEVAEGLWWLADASAFELDQAPPASYRQLAESIGTTAVMLTPPNADGRYRTRLELLEEAPDLPAWCEDVAEASLSIGGTSGVLEMASEFVDPLRIEVPAGWYRVRYCTELQDLATDEDAVITERPETYSGRHLLQLWPAERAPDRAERAGSDFARSLAR